MMEGGIVCQAIITPGVIKGTDGRPGENVVWGIKVFDEKFYWQLNAIVYDFYAFP